MFDELGSPDVLANCAGWDETRPFLETDSLFRERVVRINLLGVVAVTYALLRAMVEDGRGGRVVNVASDAARVGDTALFRAQPERLRETLLKAVPMRRLGTPEDVAHAIWFLASECASYMTGHVLSVSGGLTMAG